ncbi:serine O-acetyltransferase [Motiliproteus sp. MSK22-1]|uniref:serine O-acetyltransferase n=1 Tax=Motiliproteus sp. MSK22-1 TaxID=1897630 RepID=UPI00117ED335|nr:serine acetyltransferase [Motiliproteus sp. MSK22-1]
MRLLKSDLRRKRQIFAEDGAEVSAFRIFLSDGTSANVLYRLMRWASLKGLFPLAYLFQYLNKVLNGCVIGTGAQFEEGFVIMHPVGIVINSKVKGGENITLESGVVIGDEKGKSPCLSNNIFVGAGAKILGALVVEDGVKVGANAVLTKNAPAGSTMLGIPAKVYVRDEGNANQIPADNAGGQPKEYKSGVVI